MKYEVDAEEISQFWEDQHLIILYSHFQKLKCEQNMNQIMQMV